MAMGAAPEDPAGPFAMSMRGATAASAEGGLPDLSLPYQRETRQTKNQRGRESVSWSALQSTSGHGFNCKVTINHPFDLVLFLCITTPLSSFIMIDCGGFSSSKARQGKDILYP